MYNSNGSVRNSLHKLFRLLWKVCNSNWVSQVKIAIAISWVSTFAHVKEASLREMYEHVEILLILTRNVRLASTRLIYKSRTFVMRHVDHVCIKAYIIVQCESEKKGNLSSISLTFYLRCIAKTHGTQRMHHSCNVENKKGIITIH